MSGVAKKVGKVFKKIVPIALAVGAVVFTVGGALGLPAMAGGWGGAVAKGLGALGISGSSGIAGAITGAVTQAGYGAAIGAASSLVTGGDVFDGAAQGALYGAVSGGVMGGLGMPTDPLKGLTGGGTEVANAAAASSAPGTAGAPAGTAAGSAAGGTPQAGAVAGTGLNSAAPAGSVAGATGQSGGFFSKLLDSPVTGQVISGLGKGWMASLQQDAAAEDVEERQKDYEIDYAQVVGTSRDDTQYNNPADIYGGPNRRAGRNATQSTRANQDAERTKPSYVYDKDSNQVVFS